jgi:hypothetical protein
MSIFGPAGGRHLVIVRFEDDADAAHLEDQSPRAHPETCRSGDPKVVALKVGL